MSKRVSKTTIKSATNDVTDVTVNSSESDVEATSSKKRSYKTSRKPHMLALEPRMLFDGAAVATAVDVAQDSHVLDIFSSAINASSSSTAENTTSATDTPAEIDPSYISSSLSGAVDTRLALTTPAPNNRNELVVVDGSLSNLQTLIDDIARIDPDRTILVLDPSANETTQLSNYLEQHTASFDAIHVLSHGGEGWISLGDQTLKLSTPEQNAQFWDSIKTSLTDAGDVLLYGCNVANNAAGQTIITELANYTAADIAASSDVTGQTGDWALETTSGSIETDTISPADWQGDLGAYNAAPVIANITVNEGDGTNYAVFTVKGNATAAVTLTLTAGTATLGTDTAAAATVSWWNGSAWTTGTTATIQGNDEVLVRIAITGDTSAEVAVGETFTLKTTYTGTTGGVTSGGNVTATATIKDDGTGILFTNANPVAGVPVTVTQPTSSIVLAEDAGTLANDDRALTVAAITVNEGSYAVFTVVGKEGQYVKLALGSTAVTTDVDAILSGAGVDVSQNLEYWNGTAWVAYTPGSFVQIPSDGDATAAEVANLLVRVALTQDAALEIAAGETFTLTATNTGTVAVTAIATIKDDGTGTIFTTSSSVDGVTVATTSAVATAQTTTAATTTPVLAANINTLPKDDRAFAVTSATVNEGYGTNYAIFTVTGISGQYTKLSLGGSATAGTDYTDSLQYLVGTTWTNYTADSFVKLAATTLLVRTALSADILNEGSETLTLTATNTGAVATVGTATIMDDGTGNLFINQTTATPATITAPAASTNYVASTATLPNDDRPLTVDSFSANEAGGYAVFTVTGGAGQYAKLALGGSAVSGTDYTATFQFLNTAAATPTWVNYSATTTGYVRLASDGKLFVRVTLTNDGIADPAETITLSATNTGTITSTGTATIVEDGSGIPYADVVSVNSFTVNEGSPYAVFTVAGKEGQLVTLATAIIAGATAGTDYSNTIEYWDGSAWVAYSAGGYAQIPGDGDATSAEVANLLVRVAITNDILLENPTVESFKLTATPLGGAAVFGTATIADDGTGTMFATGVAGAAGVTAATASSLAAADIDITSTPNDDRVQVGSVTVNETGLYAAFNVTSPNAQVVFLSTVLGTGTGFASSTDIGAGVEYWDTASAAWMAYTAGSSISMTAGQILSVRIAIINESTPVVEGAETFKLQVRTATGATGGTLLGTGTATIVENGSGSTFATIAPITLNECSSYAVFTIDQAFGKQVSLSLVPSTFIASAATDNATIGATDDGVNDINNTLQYWNGGVWVNYVAGSTITTPTNTTLLVRVGVYDQEVYEGPETFTLKVADASGNAIGYGVATIMDNGTGSLYTGDATVTDASAAYSVAVTAAEKQAALEAWRQATIDKSNTIVAGNQGAFIKADNGAYYVSGANASPTGANQTTPLLVNAANGYNYTGTIIDVAVSGRSTDQYLLLTTTGLYVWGTEDIGIPTALTTSASFQRITTPADFILADVKSMTTSYLGTMFLMKDGTVRSVTTGSQYPSGHPATGDFTKVVDTTGNALTGITDLELSAGSSFKTAAFAYSATTGKFYTWGTTTYLGNGSASASRTQATEMANPLPVGVSVVQIGASYGTYFVLGSDGKVYVCGLNSSGSAGQGNTTALASWTTMRDTTGAAATSLTNVQFINAQNSAENNNGGDAIALILKDSTALAVGSGGLRNKLGTTTTGNITKPTLVAGSIAGKQVYTIDVGGYFSAAMLYNTADAISYSGEPAGAVGTTTTTVATFTSTSIAGIADAPVATQTLANPTVAQLCDDTGITINNVSVNEASPVVVFVIDVATTQTIKVAVVAGTATAGTDYTATLEYWTGSAWLAYTANTALNVTAGTKLNVRVPLKTDVVVDPNETFFLTIADAEGSVMKTGTATILEGAGTTFSAGTTVPVTVSSLVVNEGSSHAVFTISGGANQAITSLTLGVGAIDPATGSGTDFGASTGTGLEYWNGSAWTAYVSGSLSLDANGKLLVRTPIISDAIVDNNETLTLTAANTASGNAMGTVTIVDDGTGTLFTSGNPTGSIPATLAAPSPVNGAVLASSAANLPDDDRAITVNGVTVNEASPYAILSVDGASGQFVKLVLTSGTATLGTDTSSAIQYFDGTTWQNYVADSYVQIPVVGTRLLVRVAITNDAVTDGGETFNLIAANTGGATATGIATIKDDLTGSLYSASNTTGTPDALGSQTDLTALDDDRVLTVSTITVNEGSPYAVFTVTGAANQVVSSLVLAAGSSTPATGGGVDYGASTGTGLEYWNGTAWTAYTSGNVTLDGTGVLLVRTPIVNDGVNDNSETFKLNAGAANGQTATGIATIFDDGTGTQYTAGNPVGNAPATVTAPTTSVVLSASASTLPNDDRVLSVTSVTVNEASPYAIFKVTGVLGQYTSLSLASVTATVGTDTGSALEFYNGTAWTAYAAGSFVQIPNGGLLVRVTITKDTISDNGETFKLVATNTGGNAAFGVGTTADDGTGVLFSSTNTTGTPDAPGTNGAPATLVKMFGVNSVVVNEGSPYAVFSITGGTDGNNTATRVFGLTLVAGSATSGSDYPAATPQFWDGTNWVNWSNVIGLGATPALVRVAITNDMISDNNEVFYLDVRSDWGTTVRGTVTIKDDGAGTIYTAGNPTGSTPATAAAPTPVNGVVSAASAANLPNDDRALSVNSVTVNEASPYVVFTVTGISGQYVKLVSGVGTASAADFDSTSLQYFDGAAWQTYSTGDFIQIASTGNLLVRTAITNDAIWDKGETFTVTAFNTGNISAVGTATINDDSAGSLFSVSNTTGIAEAAGTNGLPATLDSDRIQPLTASAFADINEGSSHAVFLLTGTPDQVLSSLTLGDGSSTPTTSADYGSSLEVWNGTAWVAYVQGTTALDSNGKLLVRVAIVNDTVSDNAETFTLSVTDPTYSASTTATIKDDGTGTIYTSGNPIGFTPATATPPTPSSGVVLTANAANLLNDDRVLTVNTFDVNEGSPYVVFTVTGATGQFVKLSTATGTATSADFGSASWQYFNGAAWVAYTAGSFVQIPAGVSGTGTSLLVRTTVANDAFADDGETIILTASNTGTVGFAGTATIKDDGSGNLYSVNNTTGVAESPSSTLVLNNDQTLAVTNPSVNEGSPYVVFTVTGAPNQNVVGLSLLATQNLTPNAVISGVGADVGTTLQYFNGSIWTDYLGGTVTIGGTGKLLVRISVINDDGLENAETFKLVATALGNLTAVGTATILDNLQGDLYSASNTSGIADALGTQSDLPVALDNDFIVGVTIASINVNECSPYAIFAIDGGYGEQSKLSLVAVGSTSIGATDNGTNDLNDKLQYWTGSAWVDYTNGSIISIPATTDLIVRVAIYDHSNYEGPESFKLRVTDTAGKLRGEGLATIYDDGTGDIYNGDLTPTDASAAYAAALADPNATAAQKQAALDAWRQIDFDKSRYIISGFHGAFFKADGGGYYVSGESASPYAGNLTTPLLISAANGFNYTGTIIDVAVPSTRYDQFLMLTTDGLYSWGTTGIALSLGYAPNGAFQRITTPIDFVASDVKSMTASNQGVMFVMNDGTVRTVTMSLTNSGHPNSGDFTRVVDASGAAITGITDLEYFQGAAFAYSASTGKFYTWGENSFLGDGTAAAARGVATEMANPLPAGVKAVQIGISDATYFVLGSDGKVYTCGLNPQGAAGQGYTGAVSTWTTMKNSTGTAPLTNVQFFSAQNSAIYPSYGTSAINMILKDGSVLAAGATSRAMLGLPGTTGTTGAATLPTSPTGSIVGQVAFTVETGGHFSSVLLFGCTGVISATGHNPGGAFGDGTTSDRVEYVQTQFLGSLAEACILPVTMPNPTPAQLCDDRPLTVNNLTVNEGSPYAVFTVGGAAGQYVSLALAATTNVSLNAALGLDAGTTLEYFNGTSWVAYAPGSLVQIPISGTTLLVRVAITNDAFSDNAETFNLLASNTDGVTATGVGTILDNGTGDLFSSANTTGAADAPGTNGAPATLNNDQGLSQSLSINNLTVNEGSPYAVFTLMGPPNQAISNLALSNGSTNPATGAGTDYSAATGTGLEYWDAATSAWIPYVSGNVNLDGSGILFVRTAIASDTTADNGETFKLTATPVTGSAVTGIATILDDATGTQFTAGNPTGINPATVTPPTTSVVSSANAPALPNDDRPLAVNSLTVNEGSPYAVFTVTGVTGQYTSLSLTSGTATVGTDTGTALEYFNGTTWQSYAAGSFVQIPSGGLLVRVAITNDAPADNGETFNLVASNTGGGTATGVGTILDDGTGTIYSAANPTGSTPATTTPPTPFNGAVSAANAVNLPNDDRTVTVNSLTVNEGSPFAVFTVTGNSGQFVKLATSNGTAGASDYGSALQYFDGTTWQNYTPGSYVQIPTSGTTLLVRAAIFNDITTDTGETFNLIATNLSNVSATGVGTIMDDGTGDLFSANNTTGTTESPGVNGLPLVKDNELTVEIRDVVVRECSPYVIFTLDGGYGQRVNLSLAAVGSTTIGATNNGTNDLNDKLQYWDAVANNGTGAWVDYDDSVGVSIPPANDLLVRLALYDQVAYEGPESIELTVTGAGGVVRGTGLATIRDDGMGDVFSGYVTPTDASAAYAAALLDSNATAAQKQAALDAWRLATFEKSDFIVSGFHGAFYKADGGGYYVSGEFASPTAGGITTPLMVTPANGYNYTGTIIDVAIPSTAAGQFLLLTTDGLYAWGATGIGLAAGYTSSPSFQRITTPVDFIAADVKAMTASVSGVMFLMNDGTVRSVTTTTDNSGHASTPDFSKVVDANGNAIAGITDLEYYQGSAFAYSASTGKFYTWGASTYLGDGSALAARTTAVEMANPFASVPGVSAVQIGISGNTYFVLGSDGKVYVTGTNLSGGAGQNSTTAVLSWTTMRDTTGAAGTSLSNVQFISAQNSSNAGYSDSIGVILKDGSVLVLGSNSRSLLGIQSVPTILIPTAPTGSVAGRPAYAVEVGGHFSSILLYGCSGLINGTGHNPGGAFGDGTTANRYEFAETLFLGNLAEACIAPAVVASDTLTGLCDDRPVTVSDLTVNEGSPYAVFKVGGKEGQYVSLALDTGTATAGVDYTAALEYWNGTAWVAYTAGDLVVIPSDGDATSAESADLLVRVAIANDSNLDGGETFKLLASNTGGLTVTGIATIKDDGTGDLFSSANATGTPDSPGNGLVLDNEQGLSVNNLTVNEGSPYAVFTVSGLPNQVVASLALADTTNASLNATGANGADYGTSLEYWNGSAWTPYTSGSVTLDGAGKLLVRTAIANDTTLDNNETFKLIATDASNLTATGIATIKDDGSGTQFTAANPTGITPATLTTPALVNGVIPSANASAAPNDDRPLTVAAIAPVVNEASPYAAFEVSGAPNQLASLSLPTNASNPLTDIEFWNGTAWVPYNAGDLIPLDNAGKALVRVLLAPEQDNTGDNSEPFSLTATNTGGTSATPATVTIKDDGTGTVFVVNDPATSGTDESAPANGVLPTVTVPTTAVVSGATEIAKLANDDRPLTVNDVTVNEGSPFVAFTVGGKEGQYVTLALGNTASGTDTDATLGADTGTALEYWNGTAWVAYTPGSYVQIPSDGDGTSAEPANLLVRVAITNDAPLDTGETFTLTATNTGGTTPAVGTATIMDDGTGTVFVADDVATVGTDESAPVNGMVPTVTAPTTPVVSSVNADSLPNDDRPLGVNSLTVNEGSPYAVFTVTGAAGQYVELTTTNGTASSSDYGSTLEYFDGTTWQTYHAGDFVQIPVTGTTLLVRTAITNDTPSDNGETFNLVATNVSGASATGVGTIKDDGTGNVFSGTSGSPDSGVAASSLNDDRPVTVNSVTVNEASPYAVFTVGAIEGQFVSLSLAPDTATSGADYANALEYFDGTAWQPYTPGSLVQVPSDGDATSGEPANLLVRVAITNDAPYEMSETFKLSASNTGGSGATGIGTIKDDGTGSIYVATNTTATPDNPGVAGAPTLNNDIPFSPAFVNDLLVNEGSPYVVFTVTGVPTAEVTLTLGVGTTPAATAGSDYTNSLEYSSDGGTTWTPYDPANPPDLSAGDGSLLVRVPILQDNALDGGERFKLSVQYTGVKDPSQTLTPDTSNTFSGYAKIVDDGTGNLWNANGTLATPASTDVVLSAAVNTLADDDRPVLVDDVVVNEASPYAVFTVSAVEGQYVKLALAETANQTLNATISGAGADIGPALEYWNGTSWVAYTAGSYVKVPTDGDTTVAEAANLLVRVAITNDAPSDNAETYNLKVFNTSDKTNPSDTGIGTIMDDGTGTIFATDNSNSGVLPASPTSLATPVTVTPPTPVNGVVSSPTDIANLPNDDRPLAVTSVTVNEGSPYAVFTVTGVTGQLTELSLSSGSGVVGADTGTAIQYYNGSAWVDYIPGSFVEIPSGGLLVRTAITNDLAGDNNETFNLVATNTGGAAVTGVGTIKDDGTGSVFGASNVTSTPDSVAPAALNDDRPLTVNDVTVNEGSPFVAFTVGGKEGQYVTLALGNTASGTDTDATLGADTGTALEYWNGTAWVAYTPGSYVQIPSDGDGTSAEPANLLVRVAITNDAPLDTGETFTLTATNTGGTTPAVGTATIMDDGTGTVFVADDVATVGTDESAPVNGMVPTVTAPTTPVVSSVNADSLPNDDRPLGVNSLTVNEGSPYAVFTVTGAAGQYVELTTTNGTASSSDYGSTLEYFDGTTWQTYHAGDFVQIPVTGTTLLVRTAITNDTPSDNGETFNLVATNVSGASATGVGTIKDDGTGVLFASTNVTGTPDAAGTVDTKGTATVSDDVTLTLNNDSPTLSIGNIRVNELANEYAVTQVTLSAPPSGTVVFTPTLRSGTATVGADNRATLSGAAIEYFDPNANSGAGAWLSAANGVTIASGQTSVDLRTRINVDAVNEISEVYYVDTGALTGTATLASTASVTGTVTIVDPPTMSISSVTVNEGSPYAEVKVTMSSAVADAPLVFTPALTSGSGLVGTDTGSAIEYFNGTAWVSAANGVTIPVGETSMLLRTTVKPDTSFENSEVVNISTGTITGGVVQNAAGVTGTITILDDGTGIVFVADNPDTVGVDESAPVNGLAPTVAEPLPVNGVVAAANASALPNDDRPLTVNNLTVNEGSPYAVFTVTGATDQFVKLTTANGTAGSADYGSA
ncbi:DUF4347 domain-containing protein, partial [Polynucleobacter sp. 30F-ANTBAC]|uniref:DUF4347 domain-containing protein n=1 Tax=Polynucleobacter sp. 30F-ANTBAC TaxID=2689095 RepID=UPI001C0B81C9